ncbi:DUF1499 domain-containing protein [Pararhizobium sp.]|uniref:DUF1499 domain-containing protein n=1 Tax=Pararhizobium sp. TaxID=1977563 RepID=UPI00272041D4|nr:DUF1499 domain-containing protein [Pararhizobium sp.]MDO9415809.1 DUF1499 domain-containing protein [Pararhizobium sp.]
MMVKYERPYSHAAHWARHIALFAFLLLCASVLFHRFGPLTTPHLLALMAVSIGLAAIAVILALIGLVRLWQVAAKGGFAAFTAVLLSLLPLGMIGLATVAYFTRPAIHDVSTDLADAPPWIVTPKADQGWLQPQAAVTSADRAAQLAAYPALTGRRYDGALDRVLLGVRTVAEKTGLKITQERGAENAAADLEDMVINPETSLPEEKTAEKKLQTVPVPLDRPQSGPQAGDIPIRPNEILLQGEWRTLVIGFRLDVVIRLREEAETTFVDLRVASRYGTHDLGGAAGYADQYLRALDAELLGIAGD